MKRISAILLMALLAACGGDTPPTAPENVVANSVSSSEITVTWDPSYDPGGVSYYKVWRNGEFTEKTPTTGYDDMYLSNSTTYCYSVRAYDGDGGVSEFSGTSCDTTFPYDDSIPPIMVNGIVLTPLSDTEMELMWNASMDDHKIEGYHVYRHAVLINTIEGTWMVDTGLTNSTEYCYYITAFDPNRNVSSVSNTVCEFTLEP